MEALSPEQTAALAKENLGPMTKAIVIAFTTLAFVCVCLRMFTQIKFLARAIGWEDYTILISMVLSLATAVFQVLQANAGNGRHAMFVPFPEGTVRILRYLYWSIIFYNLSLCFTKVSILLQYGRIFTVPEMRIPLHIVMGICVVYGIALLFTSIFSCVPVRAYWQVLEQADAICIPNEVLWYMNASLNILCDLLVAILPVRVIWKLQIPKQQKIALMAILTIGWFVCVVSILRLHALIVLVANLDDSTWYSSTTAYWSAIEMNLTIVCASLPALKPLFINIIPGFGSRKGSGGYGTNSGRKPSLGFGTIGLTKHSRHTVADEVELEMGRTISTRAYPSGNDRSDIGVYGKNIYISRQFEQHFEGDGQNSDSESQKELVDTERHKDLVREPVTVYTNR
ncbi:hypothetical protein T440DRAFT_464603 [Plenodomus tracheiphilus IPT5]|uniref:Rhodopsin domain-containing protein n=1 Tax=Plenodomus tracheiphilus IPT5 TaxID=1408161 RepID=A0A6A7BIM8_9PLEO|nr:hypothetical protein T440DRAFT_464603 [Plenodomus tracheiphilus IPT5]